MVIQHRHGLTDKLRTKLHVVRMFKESATIYKTELHWEMNDNYYNEVTQQWVNEFEEELYIIRWETLDNEILSR